MKRILIYALMLIVFASCEDELPAQDPVADGSAKLSYKTLNVSIDSLSYKSPVLLDLDSDGRGDFFLTSMLIEEDDRPYLYLVINRGSQHLNKFLVRSSPELINNGFWAAPLEKEVIIGESPLAGIVWNPDLGKAYFLRISDDGVNRIFGGDCVGQKDKFIGLKFVSSGKYHFGWLRISHTANEERLAVLDYAYNKAPEKAILTGEK